MMNEFRIGWAEADITPEGPVELYGQYYPRVSEGIHSRLAATAMAIDGEDAFVLVSADLTSVQHEYLTALRERVLAELPELNDQMIIVNTTHTHNAPAVTPGRQWWEPDAVSLKTEEFRELTLEGITQAIVGAWQSRKAAGISHTTEYASIGHCRRTVFTDGTADMYGDATRADFIGLEGSEDSAVELLFTFDEDGEPTGAVVNVACPSQIMEATYFVSSDYMGRTRELLKERFGPDFRTVCQISAAGCQSPRDLPRTRDALFWSAGGVEIIAGRLSQAVFRAYEQCKKNIKNEAVVRHNAVRAELPIRRVAYEEFRTAMVAYERLEQQNSTEKAFAEFCSEVKDNEKIAGRPGPYDDKKRHFVQIRNNEAVVNRYRNEQEKTGVEFEYHLIRIGDIAMATNPFELFLAYGLMIKARSPAVQTFIVQLCCGEEGYLPTKTAEDHGGYGGLIINGMVGSEGGKKFVDDTISEIQELFG